MALDFSSLKKSRGNLDTLLKEVEKIATPTQDSNQKDDRFWQPEVDKAGNGSATIRFLPPPKGEDLPWARLWNHAFQGPTGKWYIENSLTTLGKPDPVSELNTELWNSGSEANKEIARKQKRKLVYISNILVVRDPAHPENEGQVKLFKFGKKIFDKIKNVMNPTDDDEEEINPFDFWKGANFKIKIRNVGGYRNYDESRFDPAKALSEDDDELETIWNKQHSLQQFVDPVHFKSYDDLKAKLEAVLSSGSSVGRADEVDLEEDEKPQFVKPKPKAKPVEVDLDDDDESLSYFAKMANDD